MLFEFILKAELGLFESRLYFFFSSIDGHIVFKFFGQINVGAFKLIEVGNHNFLDLRVGKYMFVDFLVKKKKQIKCVCLLLIKSL